MRHEGAKARRHEAWGNAGCALVVAAVASAPSRGAINLELRPADQTVSIAAGTVGVSLYAVSDSGVNQLLSAINAIVQWDPALLELIGLDASGAVTLLASGFPDDPFKLNESNPPQDGDGLYVAFAPLGNPVAATPAGTLITTFLFEPLATTPGTAVIILDAAGTPPTETVVYDGTEPNLDVTGDLSGAVVEILPCCPADLDFDCNVAITDLLMLLGAWGTNPGGPPDFDGNGNVDINDLLDLLAAWGRCP